MCPVAEMTDRTAAAAVEVGGRGIPAVLNARTGMSISRTGLGLRNGGMPRGARPRSRLFRRGGRLRVRPRACEGGDIRGLVEAFGRGRLSLLSAVGPRTSTSSRQCRRAHLARALPAPAGDGRARDPAWRTNSTSPDGGRPTQARGLTNGKVSTDRIEVLVT